MCAVVHNISVVVHYKSIIAFTFEHRLIEARLLSLFRMGYDILFDANILYQIPEHVPWALASHGQ